MKKKVFGAFAFVALVLGSMFVAAPAANALGTSGSLVAYENNNYGGGAIWSAQLNSGTCNASGYTWGLGLGYPWSVGHHISSFRLVLNPGQSTRCNYVGVQAINGAWAVKCISRNDPGFYWFGAGYNDSSATLTVRHNPNCPAY